MDQYIRGCMYWMLPSLHRVELEMVHLLSVIVIVGSVGDVLVTLRHLLILLIFQTRTQTEQEVIFSITGKCFGQQRVNKTQLQQLSVTISVRILL